MIEKMDSLKRTVLELLLGILLFGLLFEFAGLLFVTDKLSHSVGIGCGVLIAAGMAIHMAYNINDALDWDAEQAAKALRRGSMLRYATVVLITMLLAYFKIGNVISCFLGIMSLKTAAYSQPVVHKVINKIFKIEEGGYENAIIDDDDEFDFGEWAERGFHGPWSDRT